MKKIIKSIILALLCTAASASSVVYNGSAFRSTTSYENGKYTYLYSIDLWKLTSSELYTFNVFWCNGSTANSFQSNIEFETDIRDDQDLAQLCRRPCRYRKSNWRDKHLIT